MEIRRIKSVPFKARGGFRDTIWSLKRTSDTAKMKLSRAREQYFHFCVPVAFHTVRRSLWGLQWSSVRGGWGLAGPVLARPHTPKAEQIPLSLRKADLVGRRIHPVT